MNKRRVGRQDDSYIDAVASAFRHALVDDLLRLLVLPDFVDVLRVEVGGPVGRRGRCGGLRIAGLAALRVSDPAEADDGGGGDCSDRDLAHVLHSLITTYARRPPSPRSIR